MELREFLREQPGRPELLARMGRAVLLGQETSRAVVIRDSATNVLYWIACLQKLFPAPHAWPLSPSSYQDDPRGCADLNGTTGETGFTFDDSERRYRFYMFDLATGLHSEVPEAGDDYPAVASRWLVQDPDRLERFFAFMRRFNARRPAPDLISAVHLFELVRSSRHTRGERLAGMISFAARYATVQGRAELLEILGSAGDDPDQAGRLRDARSLPRRRRPETGRPAHRELAFRAWLALVRRHVVGVGQGLQAAKSAWSCLPGLDPRRRPWCSRTRSCARRAGLSPEALAFLFHSRLELPGDRGEDPGLEPAGDRSPGPVRSLDPGREQALLAAVPRRPGSAGRPSAACWPRPGHRPTRGAPWAACSPRSIRPRPRPCAANSSSQGDFEILMGEWIEIRDPRRQPRHRVRGVPALRPGFASRARSSSCDPRIRSSLLDVLPEAERVPIALAWLREQAAGRRFPADLASRCVRLANLAVPLDPEARNGDRIARLVTARRRISASF